MSLDFLVLQKIVVAVLLGSLIGLEREHATLKEKEELHFAGIRTFALFSFMGALARIFFFENPIFFWILSFSIFALVIAGYIISSLRTKTVGGTTELAAMAVYLTGTIAGGGQFFIASALTLLILVLLHFKSPLHALAHRISKNELTSTVKFMLIAFIILPLLPNKTYGPFDVLNPYLIWLMVVFISGISFASYLAIKFLGQKKGIGLTGFFAGFISSTALTLSFSHESKKHPAIVNPFIFAIVLASSAMFFRLIVELSVLNKELLKLLLFPLALMGFTGCLLAWFYWRKKEVTVNTKAAKRLKSQAQRVESPFTLKPALKFALFFGLILFVSKFAGGRFGSSGVLLASFFSGILDVDAITVSLAKLAKGDIPPEVASQGVLVAAATNTLSKAVLFFAFGNRAVAKSIFIAFTIILLVGALSLFVL